MINRKIRVVLIKPKIYLIYITYHIYHAVSKILGF